MKSIEIKLNLDELDMLTDGLEIEFAELSEALSSGELNTRAYAAIQSRMDNVELLLKRLYTRRGALFAASKPRPHGDVDGFLRTGVPS